MTEKPIFTIACTPRGTTVGVALGKRRNCIYVAAQLDARELEKLKQEVLRRL